MFKRAGRLPACVLLCALCSVNAIAANPSDMTDIRSHWARDAIYYVMSEGLFQGVSETEFQPDGEMTRGMFVTVLGRMAGVDAEAYNTWYTPMMYTDVPGDAYYAPYVCWASRYGIVNGMGDGTFAPDQRINREQMATMVDRYTSIYNYQMITTGGTVASGYADTETISPFAREAVDRLRQTGVMNGIQGADGAYYFSPQGNATRAQCATMMSRLSSVLQPYPDRIVVEPETLSISRQELELRVGDYSTLTAWISPEDTTNQHLSWFSSDPAVAGVDAAGTVTAKAAGTAQIYTVTSNGLMAQCQVTVTQNPDIAPFMETYSEKCMRIFGQVVSDYRNYLQDTDPSEYLVAVTVPVWNIDGTGNKVSQTRTLQVHKNIAATVEAIFQEIYDGPEQFPIASVGGYYASTDSEHTPGLAIDINPGSNYYCDPQGNALVGLHWDPENDPYSIPIGGDVDLAFARHGFTRGIYWRSGYKDYMHYSYFGT